MRAVRLDWEDFGSAESAGRACGAAGIGGGRGGSWWPDHILAADCCYSATMGDAVIQTLAHVLRYSPAGTRAYIVNGWPNKGLRRFEELIGARKMLAELEEQASRLGSAQPHVHRPFVDDGDADALRDAGSEMVPRGLETLTLLSAHRLTGYADHAHHLYVLAAREDRLSLEL